MPFVFHRPSYRKNPAEKQVGGINFRSVETSLITGKARRKKKQHCVPDLSPRRLPSVEYFN